MKAAFVVNARDKAKYVARAVMGALSQTYPCHIYLSDQGSKDGTFEVMEKVVKDFKMPSRMELNGTEMIPVPFHEVSLVRCPIEGPYSMTTHNRHIDWLFDLCKEEWIFQCSADDYSLPTRVEVCMAAAQKNKCSVVAANVFYTEPMQEVSAKTPVSGIPEGYVSAGYGLMKLVYGSAIAAYKKSFVKKIGPAPASCTMDVYLGYLAALDEGYFVVPETLHVHQTVADLNNMGFQGKLRGAVAKGDKEELARLNELNRFQLFELYYQTAVTAQRMYPMMHDNDRNALIQMTMDQAVGWYQERVKLHAGKITPGVM